MKTSQAALAALAGLVLLGCAGCSAQSDELESRRVEGDPSLPVAAADSNDGIEQRRARSFRFHYAFGLTGLEPNQSVRVWLPVPASNADQRIEPLPPMLPGEPTFQTDTKYGNQILYLETTVPPNGELSFDVPYQVTRFERLASPVGGDSPETAAAPARRDPPLAERQRQLFLQANSKVPIAGRPLELLEGLNFEQDADRRVRQLYDVVDRHVTYKKEGDGWGQGDVLWVCDNRYGNCTDFHSLFISLARSQGLPARFEIGFSIPTDRREGPIAGYHCWAYCYLEDRGWLAVDISEADKDPSMKDYYFGNLTPDRIAFSTGRDIELQPAPSAPPLNFFIYPHVEVDGEPLPVDKGVYMDLRFSFAEDSPPSP
jgi:transglutaminase-like putative cysteine protease